MINGLTGSLLRAVSGLFLAMLIIRPPILRDTVVPTEWLLVLQDRKDAAHPQGKIVGPARTLA